MTYLRRLDLAIIDPARQQAKGCELLQRDLLGQIKPVFVGGRIAYTREAASAELHASLLTATPGVRGPIARKAEESPLRLVGRGHAPPPAGDGCLLHDVRARLGVVHCQPGAPFQVADQRCAELRVIGQAGVVGRQAHQRREPVSLLGRDTEVTVMRQHGRVPAQPLGVVGGAADYTSHHQIVTCSRCSALTHPRRVAARPAPVRFRRRGGS